MYSKLLIYLSGLIFVFYFFFIFTLSILSLYFNGGIVGEFVYYSIGLSLLTVGLIIRAIMGKGLHWVGAIIPIAVLLFGLFFGLWYNSNLYDISFDGQSYHGEAIATLINGWNPIHNIDSIQDNQYIALSGNQRWINAYPKASWFNSVAMYRLTSQFRSIKYFNFTIIIASILIVFGTLSHFQLTSKRILDFLIKLYLTLLFCLNPISILQATNASLDGQLYGFLLILFCNLYLLYIELGKNTRLTYFYIFNTIILSIILINIKTAGLVYGLFFLGMFGLYVILTKSIHWKKILLTFVGSLVLGVAVFGYNPYITNISLYGNSLYPQFGANKFDYQENTPSNYRDKDNAEIFLASILFKTDDVFLDGQGEAAQLKIPFTIEDSEINSLKNPQLKKGGFGPLFSGIMILSLLSLCFACIKYYNEINNKSPYLIANHDPKSITGLVTVVLITIAFFLSFILTKTSNTFRYIPHLWFLIGLWSLFASLSNSRISKLLTVVVFVLVFVNTTILSTVYFGYQIEKSQFLDAKLNDWKTSGDSYLFDFGYHTSSRMLLIENQIPFQIKTQQKPCNPYRTDQYVSIDDKYSTVFGCVLPK